MDESSEMDGKGMGLFRGALVKNAFYLFINGGVSAVFGVLFLLIASRYIPPSEFGAGTTIVSVVTLLGFLSGLGLNIGIIHYLPRSENRSRLLNLCLTLTVITSIIMGCVALVIIWITKIGSYIPAMNFIMFASVLVFIVAYNVGTFVNSIYISNKESRFVFYKDSLIYGSLRLGILIVFVLLAFDGIWGVYLSWGIALTISALVGILVLLPRVEKGYRLFLAVKAEELAPLLRFSFGNYIASLLNNAPSMLFPVIIIQYLGSEQTAWFVVPWTIVAMLLMAINAISTSLFAEGASDPRKFKGQLRHAAGLTFIIIIPLTILLAIFSKYILIFFGSSYAENSTNILQILLLSIPLQALVGLYTTSEQVKGRIASIIAICAVAYGAPLIISLSIIPIIGIQGVPLSWLICQAASALCAGTLLIRGYWYTE